VSANVWQTLARDLIAEVDALLTDYLCDGDNCGYIAALEDLADEMKRRLWVTELDAGPR
jgi:hypothetical protein